MNQNDSELGKRVPPGRGKAMEGDDPFELVGTVLPGGDPRMMALCFIEEYLRMGMEEAAILDLFRQPVYQTHSLYRAYGESWVRDLIQSVQSRTGRTRISVNVSSRTGGCNG